MKRFAVRLVVLLLAFAAGVAATIFGFNYKNSASVSETATKELPIYSFCEIADNPEEYDGKVVRLSGSINMLNIHGYMIFDNVSCLSEPTSDRKFGAVKFADASNVESSDKEFVKNSSKGFCCNSVNVIVRAKFSYDAPQEMISDSAWDRTPLHFEILQFERIKPSK